VRCCVVFLAPASQITEEHVKVGCTHIFFSFFQFKIHSRVAYANEKTLLNKLRIKVPKSDLRSYFCRTEENPHRIKIN
jgi:hypothetical protein